MIHKTAMMKKCQIWNKEYCHHLDFEKVISLQNFIIERIPELIALKVDAVFASFNPFFNLFVFLKGFTKGWYVPLYGAVLSQLRQ